MRDWTGEFQQVGESSRTEGANRFPSRTSIKGCSKQSYPSGIGDIRSCEHVSEIGFQYSDQNEWVSVLVAPEQGYHCCWK